jgi:Bifunctional DNA primase/polymerase, N-terminal/Primase C terminal 2 (PriCT-2)
VSYIKHRETMLAAAAEYIEAGWYIFPVGQNKRPCKAGRNSNGRNWGCTLDLEEIRGDFERWPGAMLGLACGEDSEVIVIEVDTPKGHGVDGPAALAELESEIGLLPPTRMAVSPSGSVHRYYRWPGVKVPSRNGYYAKGVDVKADGGYVVLPPSVRKDGEYEWASDLPIADLPPAWFALLTSNQCSERRGDVSQVRQRNAKQDQRTSNAAVPSFVKREHAGLGGSQDPADLPQPTDDDEVLFALGSINPHELSYDEWFGIACAMLDHFGEDGFEHFEVWSVWTRERYPSGISPERVWQSLRNRDGYTVATIFHFANEQAPGWRIRYQCWKESKQ